jgi:hypothetical protein
MAWQPFGAAMKISPDLTSGAGIEKNGGLRTRPTIAREERQTSMSVAHEGKNPQHEVGGFRIHDRRIAIQKPQAFMPGVKTCISVNGYGFCATLKIDDDKQDNPTDNGAGDDSDDKGGQFVPVTE